MNAVRGQLAQAEDVGIGAKTWCTGTHRVTPPAATLQRVLPLLPRAGITRIANVTGLDRVGIPVTTVCRPNGKSLAVSQGKGLDVVSAKVSGAMEALELFHAETIDRPLLCAAPAAIGAEVNAVAIDTLPQVRGGGPAQDEALLWIEGHDLLDDEAIWLPYALVHADYSLPLRPGSAGFPMTSSGLASGNHWLEAVVHGTCELIERDAHTLWAMRPRAVQADCRLDLDSVNDGLCGDLLRRLAEAGMAAAVWDITSDIGIAAFLCTITPRDAAALGPIPWATGIGCHLERGVALSRAVTEAAQARLVQITGSRDDLGPRYYNALDAEEVAHGRSTILAAKGCRRFSDVPSRNHATLAEDMEALRAGLTAVGLRRWIVVDLSKPDFGLPTVRVVVPGLEDGVAMPDYVPGARARDAWTIVP